MNVTRQSGLDGVVAADTRLSDVRGLTGELIIAGYPLDDLAPQATFEEVAYLLLHDHVPDAAQLVAFKDSLVARRTLPAATLDLLRAAAAANAPVMDALRMAAGTLSLGRPENNEEDAQVVLATFPVIVATYWRLLNGQDVLMSRPDLSHAANYLYLLSGEEPGADRTRALDTYLNTVIDHGFNASTFTARVIIATRSDIISAVVGALGALKGPLHGGAPGPALEMVFEIGEASRAEAMLREKIERGDRLMGFGHRIYKVRDPRADVLSDAADVLFQNGGDLALYALVKDVEQVAVRLLEEYKPGRNLQTNVEFYTALLLHGLGLPVDLFTPTFAISRAAGWIAHCFEHLAEGRLIRPESHYVGAAGRRFEPIAKQ